MTQKDLKIVNEILTQFQLKALSRENRRETTNKTYGDKEFQYQHKINDDLYLIIETTTDSYDENEQVVSIFFAKPVKVEVTQFDKF